MTEPVKRPNRKLTKDNATKAANAAKKTTKKTPAKKTVQRRKRPAPGFENKPKDVTPEQTAMESLQKRMSALAKSNQALEQKNKLTEDKLIERNDIIEALVFQTLTAKLYYEQMSQLMKQQQQQQLVSLNVSPTS